MSHFWFSMNQNYNIFLNTIFPPVKVGRYILSILGVDLGRWSVSQCPRGQKGRWSAKWPRLSTRGRWVVKKGQKSVHMVIECPQSVINTGVFCIQVDPVDSLCIVHCTGKFF